MKKLKYIASAAILSAVLSSCSITTPLAVTELPIGPKKGVSETTVVLGYIQLNKEYGIAEAAKKGKITGGVSTVDVKYTNYIIFGKKELIITGE
ncbi:TRL domain-containing protein [Acidiluteibacter ferrifornacis]|uniref:TRL-like protein family n=1 Tax=Acidiluteibacter ferrifornacis TaxID=2692424 RepID=A0A6N9NGT0_9FLAO|nr:TRL domain-containing protein [Acidiluteibacter ferrifornacis]NBG65039.1 hypothetical protein [Acidiluteibacter ferrifornacis]